MDVKKIIHNIKQGDIKAEKAMYDYCFRHCFKIALVYCDDKAEAISVFNHAILYIFDHLHQLGKPEHLIKWSSRIIKNDCIDQIRKKTVYKNKLISYSEQGQSSVVLNEAMSSLAMEEIIRHINQLKPDYRLCFVLKEMDGYTFKEIAEKLSINENTAKWYVSEAKKRLQLQLTQAGYQSIKKSRNGFKK